MSGQLKKLHLGMLLFIAINFLLVITWGIGIDERLIFIFKIVTYLSGLLLFFCARGKSIMKYYASLYFISPLAVAVSWLADGILGALIGSVFIGIWGPPISITNPQTIINNGSHQIRSSFSGFFGGCCSYTLYERKLLLVDVQLAQFKDEHSPEDISELKMFDNKAIVHFKNQPLDSIIIQLQ